jgi:hypothetical protein
MAAINTGQVAPGRAEIKNQKFAVVNGTLF